MPAHLIELDGRKVISVRRDAVEPAAESQVANATAVVAARLERHDATCNCAVVGRNRVSEHGAEIECENGASCASRRTRALLRRRDRHGDLLEVRAVGAKAASGGGMRRSPEPRGVRSDSSIWPSSDGANLSIPPKIPPITRRWSIHLILLYKSK